MLLDKKSRDNQIIQKEAKNHKRQPRGGTRGKVTRTP